MLTNLTAIKIKGTYVPQGVGYIDDVKLETAARGVAGQPALWMESCACPTGYVGQFCESCAPGFRHSPALGGPFMPCIPCDCNNHASICDSETGRCICQHNTAGDNCELCARGYYGNALGGTKEDCLPCGCPNGGACIQVDEDIIMCTECPLGYTGHRCDSCSDGYYGDPNGAFGLPTPCQPCECNMNIDPNAIGNCNTTTGECLKCIHNTGGQKCEVCLAGYYGNALVLPKGDCNQCQCYPPGTEEDISGASTCDQTTGSCYCKPHVVGINCNKCENGYYNLHSGEGCHTCNCDPIGSINQTCDIYTGQCYCRSGVTGLRCDHCEARKYGFSSEGCKECDCDFIGSKDLQCDVSGQCPCLDNVEGQKCDRCKENKYDRQRGCVDCPDCYNLVQNAARSHNNKLNRLNEILDEIERQPTVIADEDFPDELKNLELDIEEFHEKLKKDIFHADQILDEVTEKLTEINANFDYQGKKALEDAWKRAKIVGQQSDKMTEIAHEARTLADTLDIKADEITDKAREAKTKSIETYNKVKNANSQQSQISEAVRLLKQDILSTELKLNKSKEWTKEVSNKAIVAKNNALALLNEVKNLVVPQIDIPELKQKSKNLEEEAYRLRKKTSDLFRNKLLQKAYDQEGEINDLRNDLVFCESQADGAINLWNEILERAESNYKLLAEFDTKTQQSKEEAEAALQTIGEIEDIIRDTIGKTNNAQNNLEDAKKNAHLALEKAMQADVLAKNASSKADNIKNEAELLYKNTTALSEEAELMFDRVQNTEGEFKNLLEKAKSNNTLVNEAKEKVGRAGKDTDEAAKRVMDLLGDVEGIVAELQNSPNINDKDIDRLEEKIRITEGRLKEAKLDEKLENLKKEHKLQDDLIDQYKNQIILLQKEVENIEEIVNALPDGCFKRVELEP
ncbi:hypothetical protein NQ314_018796 [Rhamnusium bicolor]|uniref:Laminin subunit gamma-1 n=1 Tax=Rhamnusium bicolor TaxID=1586634 RepID=A0AAV8WR19_9CUCU|nr:hypothetical protein NQ314_018796 [Rhamnusium bicolor]